MKRASRFQRVSAIGGVTFRGTKGRCVPCEAQQSVDAVKYSPEGKRGVGLGPVPLWARSSEGVYRRFFDLQIPVLRQIGDIDVNFVCAADERPRDSVTYDYCNRRRRQDHEAHRLENGSISAFRPGALRRQIAVSTMDVWQAFETDSIKNLSICEHQMQRHLLVPR